MTASLSNVRLQRGQDEPTSGDGYHVLVHRA
jgi:hypothetical protein